MIDDGVTTFLLVMAFLLPLLIVQWHDRRTGRNRFGD